LKLIADGKEWKDKLLRGMVYGKTDKINKIKQFYEENSELLEDLSVRGQSKLMKQFGNPVSKSTLQRWANEK
jgi:hypothetical protein